MSGSRGVLLPPVQPLSFGWLWQSCSWDLTPCCLQMAPQALYSFPKGFPCISVYFCLSCGLLLLKGLCIVNDPSSQHTEIVSLLGSVLPGACVQVAPGLEEEGFRRCQLEVDRVLIRCPR